MRILVAESDLSFSSYLDRELRAQNYAVDIAKTADEAQFLVRERRYDAAILDLFVAQQNDLEMLRRVRAAQEQLPILILASRAAAAERVQVLDLGADDLLLKPFAFPELSARVRALMRRGGHYAETVLRVEDLELSRLERSVSRAGRRISLTPKEYALLEYLMRNSGQRVTRMEIIHHVWNLSSDTMTNVVDVYINYLRKKVDAPCEKKLIHTVRGVGYQMKAQGAPSVTAA